MIKQKILSTLILLTCSLYYCQNTQQDQLVNRDTNYSTEQKKTNTYMLFDNSGQGSMTKIYNTDTGQVQFIRTINDNYIQIIPR
jgi:hypothetical protein